MAGVATRTVHKHFGSTHVIRGVDVDIADGELCVLGGPSGCGKSTLWRAIVRDPQVFLFDEPLSNLDAKLRVQMRTEIKELHQRLKTTSIYVTHAQIEAMTMAEKIVVMRAGVVEQIGDPLDLYDHPANTFV